jgi:anti-sigma regulatory factor (Ser/Thr protein kinase)
MPLWRALVVFRLAALGYANPAGGRQRPPLRPPRRLGGRRGHGRLDRSHRLRVHPRPPALLTHLATATVSLATPAHPAPLPAHAARELAAAIGAALTNVRQHYGPHAPAWVLVEEDDEAITVSVRDDGPGIPAGRLTEAATDGRRGVAQSIRGRLRDLGGTVTITSAPGQGTEVELRVPRSSIW